MFQEHNTSLARENAALTQQVNHLQAQLSALKATRQRQCHLETGTMLKHLVERLAHHIKNPMTAIGTFLQMLPDKFDDAAFRKEYLDIALEEHYRINVLIDTLLDVVDERALDCKWLNLSDLIEDKIRQISTQRGQQSLDIEMVLPAFPLTARVDGDKIGTVVSHLLANAAEVTPPGGRIRIEAAMIRDEGADAVIRIVISDTGPGISENDLNRIFAPFFTSKHASAVTPCTGFGLFIAQNYMLAHGGAITVDTTPGKGTRFILRLPANGCAHSNGNQRPCT
ncbi:MAG: HAMP domain-containing sensor histidine kinase [Pseudomonadota bacterium]